MFLSILAASTFCVTDDWRLKQSYINSRWDKQSLDPQAEAGHTTVVVILRSFILQMRTKQKALKHTSGGGVVTVTKQLNKENVKEGGKEKRLNNKQQKITKNLWEVTN